MGHTVALNLDDPDMHLGFRCGLGGLATQLYHMARPEHWPDAIPLVGGCTATVRPREVVLRWGDDGDVSTTLSAILDAAYDIQDNFLHVPAIHVDDPADDVPRRRVIHQALRQTILCHQRLWSYKNGKLVGHTYQTSQKKFQDLLKAWPTGTVHNATRQFCLGANSAEFSRSLPATIAFLGHFTVVGAVASVGYQMDSLWRPPDPKTGKYPDEGSLLLLDPFDLELFGRRRAMITPKARHGTPQEGSLEALWLGRDVLLRQWVSSVEIHTFRMVGWDRYSPMQVAITVLDDVDRLDDVLTQYDAIRDVRSSYKTGDRYTPDKLRILMGWNLAAGRNALSKMDNLSLSDIWDLPYYRQNEHGRCVMTLVESTFSPGQQAVIDLIRAGLRQVRHRAHDLYRDDYELGQKKYRTEVGRFHVRIRSGYGQGLADVIMDLAAVGGGAWNGVGPDVAQRATAYIHNPDHWDEIQSLFYTALVIHHAKLEKKSNDDAIEPLD